MAILYYTHVYIYLYEHINMNYVEMCVFMTMRLFDFNNKVFCFFFRFFVFVHYVIQQLETT